ncbi:phage tail protein [Comamonadaceae bacterium OTU4NAUVB1]|nr:phage tail protein [Comamonadaceae bacterium OTU4NAUVB1]
MGAAVGRDTKIEFAIGVEGTTPIAADWKVLGMMRGKSMKTSWETVDTTADKSPGFTKTNLVTFKSVEFSGDGVSYDDTVYNQKIFKAQAISPGVATNNQPKAWLRLTDPNGDKYEGPFIISEYSDDRPYADAATWSITAMSNGNVVFTPAA